MLWLKQLLHKGWISMCVNEKYDKNVVHRANGFEKDGSYKI